MHNGKRRLILLGVVGLTALAGCTVEIGEMGTSGGQSFNATVVEVVDGDTIDVRFANGSTERVRLLGIDTPEVHVDTQPEEYEGVPDTEAGHTCLRAAGKNASETVRERLDGERVTVKLDPEGDTRGGYGRLLGIVLLDNSSVNYELIEAGHARLYDTDFSERDSYAEAEQAAMAANRGLWNCRDAG